MLSVNRTWSLFAQHYESLRECAPQLPAGEKLSGLAGLFYITTVSNLGSIFPDLYMMIRITTTLSVTSVVTETSFSKLKLILTRLRSTMEEERLEDVMLISCENDVPYDADETINMFPSLNEPLRRGNTCNENGCNKGINLSKSSKRQKVDILLCVEVSQTPGR